MSFLRAALRSNYAFSALQKSNGLPFLLRVSPRWFSTSEAQQPPQDSTENPFFGTPDTGNSILFISSFHHYTGALTLEDWFGLWGLCHINF
ncbi:hypothetical protein L6164_009851 [Bauhinia variegata]|uniref:Uncharacterized protein n=1 Tax=Bauhinia variegata TaxID=167791 RepID=A0ACB9PRM6_BAUVA|nr:hypothetical protein L6164_009851 [Bauhinia variegata]